MSSNMGEWKIIDRIDDTNLYNKLDSKITAILNKLNKFNKLETKISSIVDKLDKLENDIDLIYTKLEKIDKYFKDNSKKSKNSSENTSENTTENTKDSITENNTKITTGTISENIPIIDINNNELNDINARLINSVWRKSSLNVLTSPNLSSNYLYNFNNNTI